MQHDLSEQEAKEYLEQGFFVRRRVLGEPELEALRAAAEQVHERILAGARAAAPAAEPAPGEEQIDGRRYQPVHGSLVKWEWDEALAAIRSMEPVRHLCAAFDALAGDPRLCGPAAGLLGTAGVSLFTDKLNFKRPGGSPFPWHQDAPYWAFSCGHLDRLTSVQLYLDEATPENGCLWVIPRSHRAGHLPAPDGRGVLGRLYTDVERIPGAQPVPIAEPAGSAIFFDPYLVHGSRTNRTATQRRALVLTYQPPGLPAWSGSPAREAGER